MIELKQEPILSLSIMLNVMAHLFSKFRAEYTGICIKNIQALDDNSYSHTKSFFFYKRMM